MLDGFGEVWPAVYQKQLGVHVSQPDAGSIYHGVAKEIGHFEVIEIALVLEADFGSLPWQMVGFAQDGDPADMRTDIFISVE